MSDTNNQTIRYSVDATGVEAGVSKLTSSATRVNQAMSQMAERTALVDRAMQEAANNGMNLSARQANALAAQVERLGRSMGAMGSQADQMRAKLAAMGADKTFGPMIDDFEQVQKAMQGTHGGMAGISRELMVMSHEALTGNFKRLGGSAMVLGEQLNVLQYVLSPLGLGLMTAAGAAAAFAAVALEGGREAKQFAAALQMTGNYAGLTADSFAKMTATVSSTTGSGIGQAAEVLRSLAASGQYTSDQMQSLATVMLDTSRVTGQSLEDVSKLYEGLAKDPAKWAQEHVGSMHNMNVATLEHIEALQRAGDKYGAFESVVDSLLQQVQDSSQHHLSAARSEWDKLTSSIEGAWAAMKRGASGNETITDQINALKRLRDQSAASPEAVKGYDEEIAALQRQRRQLQQNADQLAAYQRVQQVATDAEGRVEQMREKFATNAEKRAKELEALRKDKASIEAGGGTMPDYDKLVAGVEAKYKDHAPSTKGQISSINADASTALQLRKLAEQQAQQQLQAQRQMGLVSAEDYFRKLHDIEAKALQDEIDTEQKRVDALSKYQGSAAYKEAVGKLALLKQQMGGLDQTRDSSIAESRHQDSLSAQQFQFGLNDEVSKQAEGFAHSDNTQFMVAQMRQEYDQRYQILEQFHQRVQQLKEQYALLPQDKQAELQDRLKALQNAQDTELEQLQSHLTRQQEIRDNFSDQMHLAMTQLSGNGQTAAQTTADAFTQAWSDSTSALNTFLTTGKGSFDQFVSGVLADMAKIVLQFAEMQAMQSLMGGIFGGSSGGSSSSLLGLFGSIGSAVAGVGTGGAPVGTNAWGFHATGGHITGPGTGTSDSIPAMLSNGEYVINAASTRKYRGLLDSINSGNLSHFATGGAVGSVSSSSGDGGSAGANPVSVTVNHNGGGGLSDQDAKDLHKLVLGFVDQRMSYQMRRQGGYAQQIRYGQL